MLEVPDLLPLDPRPFDDEDWVSVNRALLVQVTVKGTEGGHHPVQRPSTEGLLSGEEDEEVIDHPDRDFNAGIQADLLPRYQDTALRGLVALVPDNPDEAAEPADDLLVARDRPRRVVPHPEVVAVADEPF